MGNLREAIFGGQLRPIRELAQTYGKAWAFNGKIGEHHDHLAKINIGQAVSIEVWNDTRWNHAMHLHGHHFWELHDQTGAAGDYRDSTLVRAREQREILCVLDNPGVWMLHCHMLSHQADGMATWLRVT